jgi:hypothetical protein
LITNSNTTNVKIAVGTQGNVFVGITNRGLGPKGDLAGLFSSQDGGVTWTSYTAQLPTTVEACPRTFGINPGHQSGIHFSLVADPNNPKVVYVGGDRQPAANELTPTTSCAGNSFPNSLGANNFTGRLFRVSDTTFAPLTDSGTANNTAPHADSRVMVFDAAGNLLEGDDGGITKRTSPIDGTGDWSFLDGNLQITEFASTLAVTHRPALDFNNLQWIHARGRSNRVARHGQQHLGVDSIRGWGRLQLGGQLGSLRHDG